MGYGITDIKVIEVADKCVFNDHFYIKDINDEVYVLRITSKTIRVPETSIRYAQYEIGTSYYILVRLTQPFIILEEQKVTSENVSRSLFQQNI